MANPSHELHCCSGTGNMAPQASETEEILVSQENCEKNVNVGGISIILSPSFSSLLHFQGQHSCRKCVTAGGKLKF
jgi:hypothetical protein